MAVTPKANPTPNILAGRDQQTLGMLGAAIAVVAWGLSSVLAKKVSGGGLAVATYRFGIFVVAMAAWRWMRGHRLSASDVRYSMWGGLFLGADVALFFSAVKLTSVLNASVIGALQPLLLGAYSWKFLNERMRPRDIALSALGLAGVIVVVLAAGGSGAGDWRGDLLAVGALFSWSGYFIVSKHAKDKVSPANFTLVTAIVTTAICAPLALAFGQSLAPPAPIDWLWLCIMAFGAGVVGHTVMNWAIPRIPLWLSSTLTLLIIPTSALLAWAIVGEAVSWTQAAGIALVLASLTALVVGQSG